MYKALDKLVSDIKFNRKTKFRTSLVKALDRVLDYELEQGIDEDQLVARTKNGIAVLALFQVYDYFVEEVAVSKFSEEEQDDIRFMTKAFNSFWKNPGTAPGPAGSSWKYESGYAIFVDNLEEYATEYAIDDASQYLT